MNMTKFIISKLMSGRWLLTVTAAGVFAYISVTSILPIDKVMEILLIVIYAYFSKSRTEDAESISKPNKPEITTTTTTTTTMAIPPVF